MIRIIINADDLGYDYITNAAIEDAFRVGCITSATILANSNTWEDVHRIVDANPNASFGVHLNLIEGKALTQSKVLFENGIVDKNNCFTKRIKTVRFPDEALQNAIFEELNAQVCVVRMQESIRITHFDSHQHTHMEAAWLDVLCRLAEKWNISYIRRRHNCWNTKSVNERLINIGVSLIKVIPPINSFVCASLPHIRYKVLENSWISILEPMCNFTDYFNGYEQMLKIVRGGLIPPDNSVIELMCHPALFKEEYEMVKNHEIEKLIPNTKLVSYLDV